MANRYRRYGVRPAIHRSTVLWSTERCSARLAGDTPLSRSPARSRSFLACSSAFIAEDDELVQLLLSKARSGVKVCIALSDPDWSPLGEHGRHELIDATRETAIRNALLSYRPLMESPHADIRLHRTVLTNSIYRSDNDILVNQHAYGVANAHAPVLHLRGDEMSEIVGVYLASLERIWSKAIEPVF